MRDTFSPLEQLVQSAARTIETSRDLRPRIVDAARQHCEDQQAEKKFGGFVLAVMLSLIISSPVMHGVQLLRSRSAAPNAGDIERLANECSDLHGVGSHFGLSEAFTQLRRFQASQLGQPTSQAESSAAKFPPPASASWAAFVR
jgi:hypothetical protein